MECGGRFVTTLGMLLMLQLCADSWVTLLKVINVI